MVGCGALGCEWLKNIMMMGIKNIDVTDPDHIEISNLSRQFLFRNKDVKESKSFVASNYIKNKDNSMNVEHIRKLGKDNIDTVNSLFENKNIIINALDNLTARRFIDNMCYEKSLPLFESGTMGMKGNTQPVVPFLTETYSDSNDPSENDSFPVCTIKNFPSKIEHTIHWARDNFEIFNRAFRYIIKYRDDKNFLNTLSHFDRNQAIDDINMFCKTPIDDWTDCLYLAKELFDKHFLTEIKQLLFCYPEDHMVNGELFWSNGKRCPKIMNHYYNKYCLDFLESTTKILCNIYGLIGEEFTREELMQVCLDFIIPDFLSDDSKKIAKDDKELKEMTVENKDSQLLEKLYFKDHFFPQTFEKDDDTNWHVKWMTSASNCRAELYNIETVSEFETKGIAGKIIPAVATTTSTIVGLISIELMKYIMNKKSIDDYKSYFVNLSDNTFIGADPMDARVTKIGNKEFNQWDKLDFKANEESTINDFINYFNEKLGINIETICYESSIIYSEMLGGDKDDNLISSIQEYTNDTTVQLILMDDKENEIPNIIIEIYVK